MSSNAGKQNVGIKGSSNTSSFLLSWELNLEKKKNETNVLWGMTTGIWDAYLGREKTL